MNPATGKLQKNGVLVTKSKDIGRLHGKSKLGFIVSKDKLLLDFIEACFLCEENKLIVYDKEERIKCNDLILLAAQKQERFETNFLILRDLRRRGHQLQRLKENPLFTFYTKNQQEPTEPPSLIATFSERESCTITHLLSLINQTKKQQNKCWLAIADEEGDITYYELDSQPLSGKQKPVSFKQTSGILLKDRVLIFDLKIAQKLHEKEFFGKEFGKALQISLVEAFYLIKKGFLQIYQPSGKKLSKKNYKKIIKERQKEITKRYMVFDDLKNKGLLVKTGFKFGNHFRAYTNHPDKTHAEYLIHAVLLNDSLEWAEVSRAIRLAHSVNKTFLFASVDAENEINYLFFKRIRP